MNIFIFSLFSNIKSVMWEQILAVSETRHDDTYDYLGRNISAVNRRQLLEPWKTIRHKKYKKTN